jgi:hypothetical protein
MDRKIEAVNYIIIYGFFGNLQTGINVNKICEDGIYVYFGEVPTSSLIFNFYS